MSENGKFLQEGTDYMDAAVDLEDQKNRIHGKYAGKVLTEDTINNLMHLRDIEDSAIVIGKSLSTTYKKEDLDILLKGIVAGYERGIDIEKYENEEMEKIGRLFEQHAKKER